MKKHQIDMDASEKEILKDFELGALMSMPHTDEEMQLAKEAAKNFMRRDNRINIRVSSSDLNMIRRIAIQEGLPYQTLVSSIIHKFVSGRLVDRG